MLKARKLFSFPLSGLVQMLKVTVNARNVFIPSVALLCPFVGSVDSTDEALSRRNKEDFLLTSLAWREHEDREKILSDACHWQDK